VSDAARDVAAALRELAAEAAVRADTVAMLADEWLALADDDVTDDAVTKDDVRLASSFLVVLSGRLTALADRLDGAA
jgi:hypothetical protein